eukprot:TRINITY_DN4785_c0_g1_i7.p1 TRINITY_DN4785_c0_g1~~TRINITY_DN4785_c0_g1_i7.p1  ORF type:complete len:922 (+),score=216.34 TRINITY_DN4785_c0_g1_i7:1186-3951(+)
MADDASKAEKQIQAYTAFFNEALKKAGAVNAVGAPLVINNLIEDLADGVLLFAIIESVTGKKAPKFNRKPRLQIQRLENCNMAISFAKSCGLKALSISGDDVEGKNQKAVLAFLWEMINVHGGQETAQFRKPWQWADEIEKKKKKEEEEKAAIEEAKRQKEEHERQQKLKWQDAAVRKAQDESRSRQEQKRLLLEEEEQRKIEAERKRGGRICFIAGDNDDAVMPSAVENMLKAGAHVLAVVPNRSSPLAEKLSRLGPGVQIVEANPNDPKALDKAFSRGVYKVVYSPKENAGMVEQAKAVAKAAKKAGVQHVVKLGLAGSESRANDLAIWHDDAEKAMEAEAVPLTKVRTAPLMNSIAKTMEDGVARLPTGSPIAWVDPRDAGLACAKAILSDGTKGKAFTITGPEKLSGDGVVDAVGDALEAADDDDDIRRKKIKRRTKTGGGAAAADADDAVGGSGGAEGAAGRQSDKVKQTESDLLAALWKKQRLHGCEAVAPDEMQAFLTQHFGLTPAQAKAEVDKFQGLQSDPTNDFEELTGQRARTLKEFATENKAAFDKPAKIFVVGADDSEGKGLAIVQDLRSAERNVPVKAAVKSLNSPEAQALRKLGCEVVEVDTLKLASVGKAMTGCDKVVLVQDARPSLPQETKTILTAAKKIPTVGHVVATSVIDADKRDDVIAQWHADAEQMLKESGVPFTVVRTAPTFTDFVSATGKSLREQGIVETCLPQGSKAAWLHPSDLATAVAKITETAAPGQHKNQTYNLTGPEELTPQQLCDQVAKTAGLQHKLVHREVPPEQVQSALEAQGLDGDVAMGKAKRLANVKSKPCSSDYEALTGLKPRPLEKFAEEHPEQFQAPERVVVLGADSPVGAEAVQKLARSGGPAGGSPVVVAVVKSLASPEAHALKSIPHVQVVQAEAAKRGN